MPANLENSEEAKRLEGVHFHFSPRENESESHSVVSDSLPPHGLYSPWNSPGQNTGVGSLSLLQGIYPTKGSRPGLPHCRQIIYQLSQTRILEWDAISISRGIFPTQELDPRLLLSQRRRWHPTPLLLPGESHGRRSLVGCSPWGRSESDRTERLHFHFSL